MLARKIAEAGGRAYYVGGFVRDFFMGKPGTDFDIEVYGLLPQQVKAVLEPFGPVRDEGVEYGVFLLQEEGVDIALPRKETKTGEGHREFSVEVCPTLPFEEALQRRDFTVNAMLMDILTGEIIDPYHGREDMKKGLLRHVGAGFSEDPLRVLRGCQFAARFGYAFAPETFELCQKMDISALPGQRVMAEMKKALCRGEKPSLFFETLRQLGALDTWFPELQKMIGLPQNPVFHPEGDVWNHTMLCLERTAEKREKSKNPFQLMLLALTHDFGKIETTAEKNGVLHAYGHETAGGALLRGFLTRLETERETVKYLENMIPLHMKPNKLVLLDSKEKAYFHLFDEAVSPEDLILFAYGDNGTEETQQVLWQKLGQYRQVMSKPFVDGKDLLQAGLQPGAEFKEYLSYAHKLRLAGVTKEEALKQTLSYAKSMKRKEKQK